MLQVQIFLDFLFNNKPQYSSSSYYHHSDGFFRSDLARQKEELEAEVRGQLKRQAAAHTEHLADVVSKREAEVTKAWQTKLFDEIIKEKDRHLKELAAAKGKVVGLERSVTERSDAERKTVSAHRLWLACNSLQRVLRVGKANAGDFDEQIEPLDKHMAAISLAGSDNAYVEVVLSSLKDDPVYSERGVYTEQALRFRFNKVSKVAKRVALVGENGGSLLR